MQGISKNNATEHLSRNQQIHRLYLDGETLESIGEKYSITKQRVWQIVRRCKIGNGNYYSAVEIESKKKELPDHLYSAWLKDKGIKTIKRKED